MEGTVNMINRYCKKIGALLIVLALFFCTVTASAAANEYTVSVSDGVGGENTVAVGETVSVDVIVRGAAFNGMQAEIQFDPSVLQMESAVGGTVSEEHGTVKLFVLNHSAYQSGAVAATLQFKAIGMGATDLVIEHAVAGTYLDFAAKDASDACVEHDRIKVVEAGSVVGSDIQVSFRLIGDYLHTDGVAGHSEYMTWIPTESYGMKNGDTVLDIVTKALEKHGLEQKSTNGSTEAIKAPADLGGYWLTESGAGPNSGWLCYANGVLINAAMEDYVLKTGDTIVCCYADDCTQETDEASPYYQRWLKAEDIPPREYIWKTCRLDKTDDGNYIVTMAAVPENVLILAAGYRTSGQMLECRVLERSDINWTPGSKAIIEVGIRGDYAKVFFLNGESGVPEREVLMK